MRRLLGALGLCAAIVASAAYADPTVYPSGVTIHEDGVAEGLVLFGAQDADIHLIDANGVEVHEWSLPCGWQGPTAPLDNGNLLTKTCGSVVEVDWDSNIVWEFTAPEGVNYHHEFVRLDNGNTLILADRRDLDVPAIADMPVWDDYLIEVEPDGDIVWEWHSIDHFDEMNLTDAQKDAIRERGGDWSHANTAQVIPANDIGDPIFAAGNIVVSNRHTNAVLVIDRSTGAIVWTMNDVTVGQHMPHIIPLGLPGAGNLLIFDNGYASDRTVNRQNRNFSRVREMNPVTKEDVWIYEASMSGYQNYTFFASFVSNAQRLPNGNTFINSGPWGRLFEIDGDGTLLWEYVSPYENPNPPRLKIRLAYRAYKLPFEWAAAKLTSDLVVSVATDVEQLTAGDALRYSLQVRNTATAPAVNAAVEQILPPDATYQAVSAPAGWDCTTPAVGATGAIRCTASRVLGGEIVDIDVDVRTNLCAGNAVLSTQVAVSSDTADATPDDNWTQADVTTIAFDCADANPCTVNSCDPASQQCVGEPVVCVALDACHLPGVCDPADGACSNPMAPDGLPCSDTDPTTCHDTCSSGVCAGSPTEEPAPVGNTLLADHADGVSTFSWTADPGEFNVYRGSIDPSSSFGYDHECLTDAGPITGNSMTDADTPEFPLAAYYLVTRVEQCRDSNAGTDSEDVPRDAGATCPSTDR